MVLLSLFIIICSVQILGITKLGHQKRILNSLKKAREERRQRAAERIAAMQVEKVDNGKEARWRLFNSSFVRRKFRVRIFNKEPKLNYVIKLKFCKKSSEYLVVKV